MKRLILQAALIPIMFSLFGLNARRRRKGNTTLSSSGHRSGGRQTRTNIENARVGGTGTTDSTSLNSTTSTPAPNRYNSNGDPMRELGPGRETHPAEWDGLIAEAESYGVEINYREGAIYYGPGTSPGNPGQLVIDPDASYSALQHEMSHIRDDQNAGWLGMRGANDREFLMRSEYRAYQTEIDYATSLGRDDLAGELTTLRDDRLNQIDADFPPEARIVPDETIDQVFGGMQMDWNR
ncbi:hypothetical protein LO763_01310 [Glycomyces sp. A-F 0318]|uniref:hypothetical protein n=1 Tax=Glycomyces amatae TaxID=2881355 RepID=UPI001E3929A3|nr:hypothetical protein [Glycomyces amatae]MCD0442263.1 hypothetical protein [Glycomyces amatae]